MADLGINKVTLLGRLGKDPELGSTQVNYAKFSLATTRKYKDKEGNYIEHTEWHNIVAFRNLADICGKYLKKGSRVYIEGYLKTNSWQSENGEARYSTSVIAQEIILLTKLQEDNQAKKDVIEPAMDDDIPF